MVGVGRVDGASAGFGGADPALFGLGRDNRDGVAGGEEGEDEFVEEDAVDTVVVGDEKLHGSSRHETREIVEREIREMAVRWKWFR